MSTIDNVIIAIDDSNQTKESLELLYPKQKTSVLFSALGRLLSKKLVIEKGRGKEKSFEITTSGAYLVKSSLDDLRSLADEETFSWILVSVSISEQFKVERERLRIFLKEWGFGGVRSGLYIGQVANVDSFKAKLFSVRNNAEIIIFPLADIPSDINNNANKIWPVGKLKKEYVTWINSAELYIKSLPKNVDNRRIKAKTLVFQLASIIRTDPKITEKTFSSTLNRPQALKLYSKIRDYCYE